MFSFKTISKNKSNYKGCCLHSSKGFLLVDNINCKFDNLNYPCSIKIFDYGIVLRPEMVVRFYNLLVVKRFQIPQFKRYLYITRHNPV